MIITTPFPPENYLSSIPRRVKLLVDFPSVILEWDGSNDMTANNSQIKVWKLPDKNLEEGMAFLSNQICKAFGGWLT